MYTLYYEDQVFEFETKEELEEKEKEIIELINNMSKRSAIIDLEKYSDKKVHRR